MGDSLDTLGDLGPLRAEGPPASAPALPPGAEAAAEEAPPAPPAAPQAEAAPAAPQAEAPEAEDNDFGDILDPSDVLDGVTAFQGPDRGSADGDARSLVAALERVAPDDASDLAPTLTSIATLFEGAPGDTSDAREVWRLWLGVINSRRKAEEAKSLTALVPALRPSVPWQEDLQYGPKDEPGMRLFSGTFVRDDQTREILWEVTHKGSKPVREQTPSDVLRHIHAASEAGTVVKFEPCRRPPIVVPRKASRGPVANPPAAAARPASSVQTEQSALFRRDSKTSADVSATRSIRVQIISIRLNAHHWEWSYSRWLENHGMFDTPSMTPYLDAKLKAHETSAAVPLLTRGTLGFTGVALQALYGNGGATAAIESREQLKREWTVERLRGLPRLSRTSNNNDGSELLVALRALVERLPEGDEGVVTTIKDEGRVALLFLDTEKEVCWSTIFAVPGRDGGDYEFYSNANWFDARHARLQQERNVRGYDSWADGTGRAAILASTDEERRQERLELAFEGLPLFFGTQDLAEKSMCITAERDPRTGMNKRTNGGVFVDVRIHDPGSNQKSDKDSVRSYSEVYREHMFAPMPVRSVQTLPKARTKPNLAMAGTLARYLNFTTTDSDPSGIVRYTKQCYPEATMNAPKDRNNRLKTMGTLKNTRKSKYEWWSDEVEKVRKAVYQPRKGSENPTDTVEFNTLMDKLDEHPELAPTTLEGVMARYLAEHEGVLAYAKADGETPLETSPQKGLHRPGGVYFSCRIDTGTKRGEGGLDSRFPVPMDASMYEIADVNLARGVHDYVYVRPYPPPGPWEHSNDFTARAGPPAWWVDEQTKMHENLRVDERAAAGADAVPDPYRFDKAVRVDKRIASPWTDGVAASDPPTNDVQDVLTRLSTIESARSFYQYLPGIAPRDEARVHRFSASQMRRLDTATGFPERAEAGGAPNDQANKWPLHYALVNRDFNPTEVKLHPTGLAVPTTTKGYGRRVRPPRTHARQAVLFDTFYPMAQAARDPQVDVRTEARAVVEALPHRHDARVPCMPIYPTLLSLDSRASVKEMVDNLHKAEKVEEKKVDSTYKTEAMPDVIAHEKHGRVRSTARSGATDGAASHLNRTLVVPIYVVALDYDDFMQAVREGDKEWHEFFKERRNCWEQKDRFRIVDDDHSGPRLEPDPDYVLPCNANPPRTAGQWETHDGPWVNDDQEVVKLTEEIRAKAVEVRKKRATISREGGVSDESLESLLKERQELDDKLRGARARVAERDCAFATRPAMRTRDSWLKDRYEFGRLRTESESDDAPSPADAFKQRVVEWERMYHEWREEQELLANHDELDRKIEERTAALRDASLHLCWGLSQLVSAKAEPQKLYASDGELSLLDDAALVRQRMKRSDDGNALAIVRTRLTLPLFLLDVLDNLDDVREHTHWFAKTHAAVTAFRSRPRVEFKYLSAMHAIQTPNWPDAQRIDCIARTAGTVLHQLIKALGNALDATDWSNLKGRIDALLQVASTDHLLAEEHRPALRPILAEWATGIVQERTGRLVRTDDDDRERLPWDALERAVVTPLSDVGARRGASVMRTDARIADLRAAAILFGLEACPEIDDAVGAPSSAVLRYARELRLVRGLLGAQRELVMDAQVFGNYLAVRSERYERTRQQNQKDHLLIKYTADAFSRLFLTVNDDALVALNKNLVIAMESDYGFELYLVVDGASKKYQAKVAEAAGVEDGTLDKDAIPTAFYAALEIVHKALELYGGRERKRAEDGAKRLMGVYRGVQKTLKALESQQEAVLDALQGTAADNDAAKARLVNTMNGNGAKVEELKQLLASIEKISESGSADAIDKVLRAVRNKRRRADSSTPLDVVPPMPPSADVPPGADVPMPDAAPEPGPSNADAPMPDVPLLPDDDSGIDPYGQAEPVDVVDHLPWFTPEDLERLGEELNGMRKEQERVQLGGGPSSEGEARADDGLRRDRPMTTQSAIEFAGMRLKQLAPSDDPKKQEVHRELLESTRRDALAPHRWLAERLDATVSAQRARLASLRAEREAADGALRRAVASARAELLSPDALDAAAREARRARQNAALRDVQTLPGGGADDDGLSYSAYLARLEGVGIEDPDACNDDNLDVVDKHELWGWKGKYRRYVAQLLRVVDGHWVVDEPVLSPAEWLERGENAQYAPGPPRPSQARVDAASAADADALRAASLEQTVEGIVGPGGDDKDAARVQSTLLRLLEADRRGMQRTDWPWDANYYFDFDGTWPSSVVARAE